MRYFARRLLHAIVLLAAISLAAFALIDLAPGDFLDEMRLNPQVGAGTIAALRSGRGLDRPWPVRYGEWLRSAATGNLGVSLAYGSPVADLIAARARNTLLLTGSATLLAWLVAVPLGLWAAARKDRWPDRACSAATSALLAVPDLLVATGLLLLALRAGLFPASRFVLPVAALVWGALPSLVRHVRSSAREALETPFIQSARALGIPPRRLLFRYVLPAASNPLISLFGLSVAGLLSSSLLIEVVMGWPGLGPLFLDAISSRDGYVVIGVVVCSGLFLVAGNLLADLLLYACDPRIRRPEEA